MAYFAMITCDNIITVSLWHSLYFARMAHIRIPPVLSFINLRTFPRQMFIHYIAAVSPQA